MDRIDIEGFKATRVAREIEQALFDEQDEPFEVACLKCGKVYRIDGHPCGSRLCDHATVPPYASF